MTRGNVAERTVGTIDFIMMCATHDAFGHDLKWLASAAAARKAGAPKSARLGNFNT